MDISGYNGGKGPSGRQVVGPSDFYRRVPREMTEVRYRYRSYYIDYTLSLSFIIYWYACLFAPMQYFMHL